MSITLRGLKGSALTHAELDNNFIFLKSRDVVSAGLIGSNLVFTKDDGGIFNVNLSGITGGGSSGNTYITTGYTQNDILYLFRNDAVTIEIPLIITGATVLYNNSSPTPTSVGGVDSGSTFVNQTMQEMWDDLLYPDLTPKFTAFSFLAAPTNVDVGYTITSGASSFTWTTTNPTFIQTNSIEIKDVNAPLILFTGLTNDGIEPYVLPFNIQKTTPTNYIWQIKALRSNGSIIARSDTTFWRWRIRWGSSIEANLTAADVSGLTSSVLGGYVPDVYGYAFSPGTYKHICIPNTLWSGNNVPRYIRDNLTGFNMAMATPVDGYNTDNGFGWFYDTITGVPNNFGYTTSYRCYRSKYQLGGFIEIDIKN